MVVSMEDEVSVGNELVELVSIQLVEVQSLVDGLSVGPVEKEVWSVVDGLSLGPAEEEV